MKAKKDFQNWHNKKTKIDDIKKRPFFHEREIWWCSFGVNVGFEQDGGGKDFLRPIIIFKKFNNEIFLAIPLTHTDKKTKYYFHFVFGKNFASAAILSQVRLIDSKRLSHKLGDLSDIDFENLTKKFKAILP